VAVVAIVVVVGRVGGLFNVLLVLVRAVGVAPVFDAVEVGIGRLVAVVPTIGRLAVGVPALVLAGDIGIFSLDASGLDLAASSPPESMAESTGVAGGGTSTSALISASISTSTSEETGTGSSVDAILSNGSNCDERRNCYRLRVRCVEGIQMYRIGAYEGKRKAISMCTVQKILSIQKSTGVYNFCAVYLTPR
jgi:hypothetical protein